MEQWTMYAIDSNLCIFHIALRAAVGIASFVMTGGFLSKSLEAVVCLQETLHGLRYWHFLLAGARYEELAFSLFVPVEYRTDR